MYTNTCLLFLLFDFFETFLFIFFPVFQSLCDACGIALAALIVDKIGRKISIQLFFLISSISLLMLTMVTGEESVLVMSGLMQFAQAICWVVIALYTCEAFTTSVRTTAMGFANTFAR